MITAQGAHRRLDGAAGRARGGGGSGGGGMTARLRRRGAIVDHMAKVMDLDDPRRNGGRRSSTTLAATAQIAALVADFPLDDHIEPAPVFEP